MTRRLLALLGLVALTALFLPATSAQSATPTCFGKTPNLVGTESNDWIALRNGVVDIVWAGGGDDYIFGPAEGGPPTDVGDWICGGPGNDRVFGSAGPDHVNGGDQDDEIEGWRGADILQGNAGNDRVRDDSIDSNDTKIDTLRGGIGNDIVASGWGADKLYGEGGDDLIQDWECSGPTVLNGGPGNDVLESYWSSYDGMSCVGYGTGDKADGGTGTDYGYFTRTDTWVGVEKVSFPTTR